MIGWTSDLPTFLSQVAWAYERLEHRPNAYHVRYPYQMLCAELWSQYQQLQQTIDFRFTETDPYDKYSDMFTDMDRRVLYVYTYHDMPSTHPLTGSAPNGESWNNIFRAVHDALAHYPERNDFTYRGEFRAFQAHCRLLSPVARYAIATETLGQNSALHFGRHAHLPLSIRPYTEQKADILPLPLIHAALAVKL